MEERLIAMVPTPPNPRLLPDDIIRAMRAFIGPADGEPVAAKTDQTQPNSFVVTIAGASVAALSFPFRIPDETVASAIGNELIWRGAADAFASAAGHVLLAVVNPINDPSRTVRQARALTIVTAAVLTSMRGKGVFWSQGDCVIDPERFRKEAADLRASEYASPLWFSIRFFPGSTDAKSDLLVCQSTGLTIFLGRDLECGPYRMPPAEIAQAVLTVARYMASAGAIFGDGHTLGFGESQSKDARLRFAWSSRGGVERPVFRLELASQEAPAA
jgi:hypothetical protein